MQAAIDACTSGSMGFLNASKDVAVPRSTLRNRISKSKNKRSSVLTCKKDLCGYLLHVEEIFLGMTREDVRSIAYQLAVRNGIQHPFNLETNLAGTDWLQGFLKRHPRLSLRTLEQTPAERARGLNRNSVAKFFNLLDTLVEKHAYDPGDTYNVDEMGMTTVQRKPLVATYHQC